MIFPILQGFLAFKKAPMTWVLVSLQIFLFVTAQVFSGLESDVDALYEDHEFLDLQGKYYAQYLQTNSFRETSSVTRELASLVKQGSRERSEFLGGLAFRDFSFLEEARQIDFTGDDVAMNQWRRRLRSYLLAKETSLTYAMGLSDRNDTVASWFTYQFAHGSFIHLISNLWFLIVVGGFLEVSTGALGILVLFLLSGASGALAYTIGSGLSSAPMIGASGAISGLVGFACVMNARRNLRFWYWLLPHVNYTGFIYLPFWSLLLFWALSDMAGSLGSLEELGGIAHMAHLGGMATGVLSALILIAIRSLPSSRFRLASAG